ncbi:MAG: stress response translation initiation inhibitor YciH [Candidatus Marsarchaeota archaeon]|nr:stress response translation initiation inhibitor YciH [Candidatus Marsarchaeota archaeon]MCL5094930.1 stress response translation initiation inhibitor YciH [Candidatus Marsarchaeota archaeon]
MPDICPKCGLPKDICVCSVLDKEGENKIKVYLRKVKFKKMITVVDGIDSSEITELTKKLKRMLACGGTVRDLSIELQGDHKKDVVKALLNIGYKEINIDAV